MFEDLILLKGDQTSPFDLLTEQVEAEQIASFQAQYPGLPRDYLDYLGSVGWGQIAGNSFMIYSGPLEPAEIYESGIPHLENVLLIGDDMAGHAVGVSLVDGSAIEVGPSGYLSDQWPGFERFIRERIARFMTWWPDRG